MYRSRFGKKLDDITLNYVSSISDDSDIAFYDIMGSEAHGISRDNYSHLSDTIAIPKIGKGESLNIGVAMGILLHQLTK